MYLPDQNMHVWVFGRSCLLCLVSLNEFTCYARVMVSEMATLCVPKTDSSSYTNLCEEYGKELETQCFFAYCRD